MDSGPLGVKAVARAAKKAAGVDMDKQIALLTDNFKAKPSSVDLLELCGTFATIFNNHKEKLSKCQNLASKSGLGDTLVQYLDTSTPADQENVLHCLKWLCISNFHVSRSTYSNTSLLTRLHSTITAAASHHSTEETLIEIAALRLVNTISRVLWDEHSQIITQFLPCVLSLLEVTCKADVSVRAQAVNFVTVLSYNGAVAHQLKPAVNSLVAVVKAANKDMNYFGAAIAIGNLGDGNNNNNNNNNNSSSSKSVNNVTSGEGSVLSDLEWRAIIQHLRQALIRSLEDQDYPEGSRRFYTSWMLCLCISNMCARPELLELIRKGDLEESLRKGLHKPPPPGELQNLLHQYCVLALTYIDLGIAPPIANNSNNSTSEPSLSGPAPTILPFQEFDMEGTVSMRMQIRWHTRYAVLNRNILRYWKTEETAKLNSFVDPRGRLVVKSVAWAVEEDSMAAATTKTTITEATTETNSDVVITTFDGRQALMRFDSLAAAHQWYNALLQNIPTTETANSNSKISSPSGSEQYKRPNFPSDRIIESPPHLTGDSTTATGDVFVDIFDNNKQQVQKSSAASGSKKVRLPHDSDWRDKTNDAFEDLVL